MTIISRKHNFIFVHLAKCGGTSVEQAFGRHAAWRDIVVGSTATGEALQPYYRWWFGLGKHSPARKIREAIGADVWSRSWKVALVRHPLRRFESLYGWIEDLAERYKFQNAIDHAKFIALVRSGRLEGFLGRSRVTRAYVASDNFSDFVRRALAQRVLFPSQTWWLSDKDQIIVDDVFKLEEMPRFWDAFEQRTGLKLERLHANRTAPKRYEWDERALRAVRRRFRQDFANFGYERP